MQAEIKDGCLIIRVPISVVVDAGAANTMAALTKREREVLNHLLEGMSNKEIGNKVNLSERTIKFHVSSLLRKTDCVNRIQLAKKFAVVENREGK